MEKIIMYDSPEAAKYLTNIKGWIDSQGQYFGDRPESESMARYSSCTHRLCECGNIMPKGWTKCYDCREKKAIERYNALEVKEWDEEMMLYSDADDRYFYGIDEAEEYAEEMGYKLSYLRLLFCEPQYLRQIDEDYWIDDLPKDGEISDTVKKALNEFNKILEKEGPVSWVPGKYRVKLED